MTAEQQQQLADDPRYLEKHEQKLYEMLSGQGITWHMFGPYVMFTSPMHYPTCESEDAMFVLEFTLRHRAAADAQPKFMSTRSLAGLLTPDGQIADIPSSQEEFPMILKEEK